MIPVMMTPDDSLNLLTLYTILFEQFPDIFFNGQGDEALLQERPHSWCKVLPVFSHARTIQKLAGGRALYEKRVRLARDRVESMDMGMDKPIQGDAG